MWWTYPFKVNMALASMGVPPNLFEGTWRSGMQQIGKAAGLTPQETALVIVGYGLGINYPDDVETAIGVWRHEGKINLSKPEVIEALWKMGFNVSRRSSAHTVRYGMNQCASVVNCACKHALGLIEP